MIFTQVRYVISMNYKAGIRQGLLNSRRAVNKWLAKRDLYFRVADRSDRTTVMNGLRQHPSREEARLGEVCCSIDSHVDRRFLIEVFFISAARKFLQAATHEQLQRKSSSNTRLTKGVLCPERSIPSTKSCTVR